MTPPHGFKLSSLLFQGGHHARHSKGPPTEISSHQDHSGEEGNASKAHTHIFRALPIWYRAENDTMKRAVPATTSTSRWGCGAWPVGAGEFIDVVHRYSLLCVHDLTLASSCCRVWRVVFVPLCHRADLRTLVPPCYHHDSRACHHRNPLECACRRGSASLLSFLASPELRWDPVLFPRAVECAAESGSVGCVSRLLELGACWTVDTFKLAEGSGNVELARFLRLRGCPLSSMPLSEAARWGHLEMLRYLHEECGCSCASNELLCHWATKGGHLECLRYLRENGARWHPEELGMVAGESGRLDVLKYLLDNGVCWTWDVFISIAFGGHVEFLRACHIDFRPLPWREAAGNAAGDLECLKYIHELGCSWDADEMCLFAAWRGSEECLNYCLDQGCAASDPEICTKAAGVSVEMLHTVRERGCPWKPARCYYKAINADRLDVVQYLHEHGCPWDEETSEAAACRLRILKYCHESGCPWDERTCVEAAKNRSSASCLAYARDNGCPWSERVMESAAEAGSVVCLKYGRDHGLALTSDVCIPAIETDCLAALKYARSCWCPWDAAMLWMALECDSVLCFKFCFENGCPRDAIEIDLNDHPVFEKWVTEGHVTP